jgi:hypothetical protein
MPRILIVSEQGHQLPRITTVGVPHAGDEVSLVAPDGTRKQFDVMRVARSVPDPSFPPDAFAGAEGDLQTEDVIVVVRPSLEPLKGGPYR